MSTPTVTFADAQAAERRPWVLHPDVLYTVAHMIRARQPNPNLTGDEAEPVAQLEGPNQTSPGGAVAVIPVRGTIRPRPTLFGSLFGGSTTVAGLRAQLRTAMADQQVGAIVLDVDSPGGMVDGIPELAAEMREMRARKPIVGIANTLAASGAYWLAAQADELFVAPSGQIGSIGVYILHEEFSRLDERIGITTNLIKAGKYKTEGNPFEPLTDEARAAMQAKVDDIYGMFIADVSEGRGVDRASVEGGFGEGRLVLAEPAVDEGMADQLGTLEDAIVRAGRLASRGGGSQFSSRAQVEDPAPTPPAEPAPPPDPAVVTPPAPAEPAAAVRERLDLSDPRHRELVRARMGSTPAAPSDPNADHGAQQEE
jgi:capsid assembly protease